MRLKNSATTKLENLRGKGKVVIRANEIDEEADKRPWLLKIPTGCIVVAVCLIGAGYVGYCVHLLSISADCKKYSGFWFIQDCLAALPTNNIGDALSGAFAPLAFIFLAGALIIQALELAAQRYEIDETQQVMKAQVAETKASTELLKIQTEILQNQYTFQLAAQANDEFDKKIYQIKMFISPSTGEILQCGVARSDDDLPTPYLICGDSEAKNDVGFYAGILRRLNHVGDIMSRYSDCYFVAENQKQWNEFHEHICALKEISDRCSPSYKSLAKAHYVYEIYGEVSDIHKRIKTLPDQN